MPLSNSWLPTDAKSAFIRLVTIVDGSPKKRPSTSGLAPMLSPAMTLICLSPYCACLSCTALANQAAPPANWP